MRPPENDGLFHITDVFFFEIIFPKPIDKFLKTSIMNYIEKIIIKSKTKVKKHKK